MPVPVGEFDVESSKGNPLVTSLGSHRLMLALHRSSRRGRV
jgi:hypothetical protein